MFRKAFIIAALVLILGAFLNEIASPTRANHVPGLVFSYLSPRPGSQHISPFTSLAIRQGEVVLAASVSDELFTVTGSKGGEYKGEVRLSTDQRTLLFYPIEPFAFDEAVTVTIRGGLKTLTGEAIAGTTYQFNTLSKLPGRIRTDAVVADDPVETDIRAQYKGGSPYHTHPEFDHLMPITLTVPGNDTGEGFVFFTDTGIGTSYDRALYIYDNDGEPVYIQVIPGGLNVFDFKLQRVNGTDYLVYHAGEPVSVWSNGSFYVMDDSYTMVDSWTIGNGYGADEHEIQLLPNGNALMLSYVPIPYDLSPYGGPADGEIIDCVVQEQDPAKNVVFEWHASQHIPIESTYNSLSNSPVDYIHCNAIEVDTDGHLLISSRNICEVTKVNRQTGQVIWHLGGKLNEFDFGTDIGFSRQHDIRRLENGNIMLFDNGNDQPVPYSRVVEYVLDETQKTATLAWEYPEDERIFAPYMGGAQRLPNGNTMIGWGAVKQITEVTEAGAIVFDMVMGGRTYRAYRFPWEGNPAQAPRLVLSPESSSSTAVLYFSWNGATGVNAYDIYAGADDISLALVRTVNREGFETRTEFDALPEDICTFQVVPQYTDPSRAAPPSNIVYWLERPDCLDLLSHRVYLPLITNEAHSR